MGNTGVFVPCTIACTAIGISGVTVAALVSVAAGDGVMTKKVGVSCAGRAVLVPPDGAGAVAVEDAVACALGAALGIGAVGTALGRFIKNSTAATATDKKP